MPFSVYAQLTKAEFVRLAIFRTYRNPFVWIFSLLGGVGILAAIFRFFGAIPELGSPWSPLICGLYFFLSSPVRNALVALRVYNSSEFLSHGITYSFDEDGVQLFGDRDLEMKIGWSQFTKKQLGGHYILLYTGRTNAYIIPKDQFAEEELDFIATKVPKGRF